LIFGICFLCTHLFAQVAQLVEQRTENPRVTGSIPVLGIYQGRFRQESFLFWHDGHAVSLNFAETYFT
jgi:hypothetical protein